MAATVVGFVAADNNGAAGTNPSVTLPTSGATAVADGDVVVLVPTALPADAGAPTPTGGTGWRELVAAQTQGTIKAAVHARTWRTGDPVTLSAPWSAGSRFQTIAAVWLRGTTLAALAAGAVTARASATSRFSYGAPVEAAADELVLTLGWERTTATETVLTSLVGADLVGFKPGNGDASNSIVAAQRTTTAAGATPQVAIEYPNSQTANGAALQLRVPTAPVVANFDGGAAGTPAGALGPLVDSTGTRVHVTPGLHGAAHARVPADAAGSWRVPVAGRPSWTLRWYGRLGAGALTGHTFLAWVHDEANAYLADFQLRNTAGGALYNRFNFGAQEGGYTTTAEARDTWARFEYTWVEGSYCEVRVWRGANIESTGAPDLVLRRDGITGKAGYVYLGTNRAAGHTVDVDSVAFLRPARTVGPHDPASTSAAAPAAPVATASPWVSSTHPTAIQAGWFTTGLTAATARLALAGDPGTVVVTAAASVAASGWATARFTGLQPDTAYVVSLLPEGAAAAVGAATARTTATAVRRSVVVTSSCQRTGSNHVVFDQLRAQGADFFAHQGDVHYADTNVEGTWRDAFRSSLTASRVAALLGTVAMPYTWDNHDSGGNGSSGAGAWAGFAPAAVRELAGTAGYRSAKGLEATWVHAGVRYVNPDRWAYRDDQTIADSATKTMFGAEQLAWFLDLLTNAPEPVIVWLSGFPLYDIQAGRWGSYPTERNKIRAHIAGLPAAQRAKIVAVGGDSHAVHADSGANALFGVPSLNASPLDQSGGLPSGTWDIGNIDVPDARGYFSRLTFDPVPRPGYMRMTWDAVQDDGAVVMTWSKDFPTGAASPWSLWDGTRETPLAADAATWTGTAAAALTGAPTIR